MKALAKELGIYEFVIFAGNRGDIPEILNLLDVFVLPSLREGTSLSLLEAMASGVPTIVTNVGGNPYIVKDGFNGYLVEPKDFDEIALKIIKLINDSEIKKMFKNNSRNSVKTDYSISANVEEYKKIYLDLLKKY